MLITTTYKTVTTEDQAQLGMGAFAFNASDALVRRSMSK
jgi:hypothetical protein